MHIFGFFWAILSFVRFVRSYVVNSTPCDHCVSLSQRLSWQLLFNRHFPVDLSKKGINVSILKPRIDGLLANYDTLTFKKNRYYIEPWDQIIFRSLLILPIKGYHIRCHLLTCDVEAEATLEAEDITGSCMANLAAGVGDLQNWRFTLAETNIAPENGWLENEISYWDGLFSGVMLVSGRVKTCTYCFSKILGSVENADNWNIGEDPFFTPRLWKGKVNGYKWFNYSTWAGWSRQERSALMSQIGDTMELVSKDSPILDGFSEAQDGNISGLWQT